MAIAIDGVGWLSLTALESVVEENSRLKKTQCLLKSKDLYCSFLKTLLSCNQNAYYIKYGTNTGLLCQNHVTNRKRQRF